MIEATRTTSPTVYTVESDRGLLTRCPECDGRDFLIEGDMAVLFACLGCGSRWRYSLGFVWRVAGGSHPDAVTETS